MANWQRKSEHLLRENVKFQTYVDSLTAAQKAKEEYYDRQKQQEAGTSASDSIQQNHGLDEGVGQQ